ncbi:MAG: hypothetical protein R3F62_29655 [Planctomycetota bacterium]
MEVLAGDVPPSWRGEASEVLRRLLQRGGRAKPSSGGGEPAYTTWVEADGRQFQATLVFDGSASASVALVESNGGHELEPARPLSACLDGVFAFLEDFRHAMGSPLGSVTFALAALLKRLERSAPADLRPALEGIEGEVNRLVGLLHTLEPFGRPRWSRCVPLSLDGLASELVEGWRHRLSNQGADVSLTAPAPVFVWSDPDVLRDAMEILFKALGQDLGLHPSALEVTVREHPGWGELTLALPGAARECLRVALADPCRAPGPGVFVCRTLVTTLGGGLELDLDPDAPRLMLRLPVAPPEVVRAAPETR